MHLEALRHHRADLFLQFATWEAKAVCKIHDRMFVVQNGKPLGNATSGEWTAVEREFGAGAVVEVTRIAPGRSQ